MDKSKYILVTGGAGYIGSHTVRLLAEGGYKIVVVDNMVYGHEEAIVSPGVELIKADLGDTAQMDAVFVKYQPQAVLHFAAYAYVGESVTEPAKYYHNNVIAPIHLLDVMRKHNCLNFIFSSTCASYGNPQYIPIDEQHPQAPINPYGRSKYILEQIIKDYELAYGFKYVFLRYFNASGCAEDALIGEDHNPETHLIPLILDAANGDRPHITVFGTDYDTPDGTCIRDYIHVLDLGRAHIAAVDRLLNGGTSVICNLGTGKGNSVNEVIKAAEKVTGLKVPVVYGERRAGDPARLVANAEKAKQELGWVAQYNDIEKIITTAWAWKSGSRKGRYSK